jgi:hypothetical protein
MWPVYEGNTEIDFECILCVWGNCTGLNYLSTAQTEVADACEYAFIQVA